MSNTTNSQPQGQRGPHDQKFAQQQQPLSAPSAQKPEAAFFRWIRESHVERTNDRVVAGVCGAIARELGWSVTLVRVLMVIAILFTGFGAVFYGLAWLLLPDELDHRILLEELCNGHWDWQFIGVILCLLLTFTGGIVTGLGSLILWNWWDGWSIHLGGPILAMLLLYLCIEHGRRRFMVPQTPIPPPASGGPMSPTAAGVSPQSPAVGMPQSYPSAPAMPTPSRAPVQSPTTPMNNATPSVAMPAPVTMSMPPVAQPLPQPRRARRKPAGSIIVLLTFGILLASLGVISLIANQQDYNSMSVQAAQLTVIYCGAVCLALGALIIGLGIAGKRTGGLHPFVWLSMVIAVFAIVFAFAFNSVLRYATNIASDYTHIELSGTKTIGAINSDMATLKRGIAVTGTDYDTSVLYIDLAHYAKEHKPHQVTLNNGATGTSDCPTGVLPMVVRNARVVVTLPQGCSWGFSGSTTLIDGGTATWNAHVNDRGAGPILTSLGGRSSVASTNPFISFDQSVQINNDGIHLYGDGSRVSLDANGIQIYGNGSSLSLNENGIEATTDTPDIAEDAHGYWYAMDDLAMCQGVEVEDGKVTYQSDTPQTTRDLIAQGRYWPCAPLADQAVSEPELIIAPHALIGGNVTLRYTK